VSGCVFIFSISFCLSFIFISLYASLILIFCVLNFSFVSAVALFETISACPTLLVPHPSSSAISFWVLCSIKGLAIIAKPF